MNTRNESRYTDGQRVITTLVKAEVEDKNFVCYTTATGKTITTKFTNQLPLGEQISIRITYDRKYSKYRVLG